MSWQLLAGDCLAVLPTLPAESVRCCVTSPPYWGLRDYGTATWEGGASGCSHVREIPQGHASSSTAFPGQVPHIPFKGDCGKCGARRIDAQLGLEKTPDEYVARLVAVFREVRRVLTPDGTLFLNLGDSYATGAGKVGSHPGGGEQGARFREHHMPQTPDAKNPDAMVPRWQPNRMPLPGLKPKDLVGVPWRVAFALQADGWYLRSDIIWAKPNPMPESVTDRPTKAHEYLFLLAKSERYYYDQEAIREPNITPADAMTGRTTLYDAGKPNGYRPTGLLAAETRYNAAGRNRRTVWTIATQPYAEAHFATFPPDLVKPCVMAGSKPGDTVLDPFAGSGTAVYVAHELGRHGVGIELNPAYLTLAERRLRQEVLAFP